MNNITPSYSSRKDQVHKRDARERTTILHLTCDLESHPEAREIVDLCIQTHRSGWRPLIASSGGGLVLEAERAAVRHTKLNLKKQGFWADYRHRKKLERLVRRENPVLIHAHGFDVIAVATKLAAKTKLPLLIDLTEPGAETSARKKNLHRAAEKGARFRVPSDYMVRHLQQDFELETEYLYRIHPGVDLGWFEAVRVTPERIQKLAHLWRLPEDATILINATPFAPGFGHKDLLDAMSLIPDRDIYAVLLGDDKAVPGTRSRIEKYVAQKKLEGKVIMPEECPDWPAACWLASLIISVNATPRGQASELLAAQAIGRPVLVTDCGCNIEMVRPGETAWVVGRERPKELAQALEDALSMSAPRKIDLAVQTRDFITQEFPMEAWRDSIFGLYDAMLGLSGADAGEDAGEDV